MKIEATLSAINVLGDSSGDITTKINEKEYRLSYAIRPYYFRRHDHRQKRVIAINFPDSKTLSDFGIEVDFSKVKWNIGRSLMKSIKEKELDVIRKREAAYDGSAVHKLCSDVKDLLVTPFVYKGITITPTFTIITKKVFVANYYSAEQIPLFISYKWEDSEKKNHETQFEIEIKQNYQRNGLKNTPAYSFKQGYTPFKGVWKRLDKIVLKIDEVVKDKIDSTERIIEGNKQRKDHLAEMKAELGDGVMEINGHIACVKREPILEGEEYKKKNYVKEWKVEFNRYKDDKGSKYQYVNLRGSYTPEQMKRIIEIVMEAKPEEVYI